MLGYTQATIERKAKARGMSGTDYTAYLILKRKNRAESRRKAKVERTTYLLDISTWTEQERKAQGLI